MRIISKHKDYYDHAMMHGIDETVVYPRKLEDGDINMFSDIQPRVFNVPASNKNFTSWIPVTTVYAIVAGVMYPIFLTEKSNDNSYRFSPVRKSIKERYNIAFDINDVVPGGVRANSWMFSRIRTDIDEESFTQVAKDLRAPVIVIGLTNVSSYRDDYANASEGPMYDIDGSSVCINPSCLEQLGFIDLIPPHEMYEKIYSFMLNINEKPMIVIDDKDKIKKAGFDTKVSFRHRK